MTEDTNHKTEESTATPAQATVAQHPAPARSNHLDRKKRGGGNGPRRRRNRDREQDEFESKIVDLARVTRVMAGGKRMRFRACVVVGDRKGRVGMATKKGADVQSAVAKATDAAKKHLITVPLVEPGTIPHAVRQKHKGARVMLRPAKGGTGVIAGGAVRIVMDLAGVDNIVAKMHGSSNKVNNVHAVMAALDELRSPADIKSLTS